MTDTNIYFGRGKIDCLSKILTECNSKNIFLVRGKNSYQLCGIEKYLENYYNRYSFFHFFDFKTNPRWEDCQRGIDLASRFEADTILAVGGGSVIDMAKTIRFIVGWSGSNNTLLLYNPQMRKQVNIKLIAIPTTAGTGSEVTHFSVVYDKYKKISLSSQLIKPDYVIVDPCLTYSTPQFIRDCNAFDSFSQALESCWSMGATSESLDYSCAALRLIVSYFESSGYAFNADKRDSTCMGALLSGKSIDISKTTAIHALSYPLTIHYGIPHGQAVALLLPFVLKYTLMNRSDITKNKLSKQRWNLFNQIILDCLNINRIDEAISIINKWLKSCNLLLNNNQKKLIDIDLIVQEVNLERLSNHPVNLSFNDMINIVKSLVQL